MPKGSVAKYLLEDTSNNLFKLFYACNDNSDVATQFREEGMRGLYQLWINSMGQPTVPTITATTSSTYEEPEDESNWWKPEPEVDKPPRQVCAHYLFGFILYSYSYIFKNRFYQTQMTLWYLFYYLFASLYSFSSPSLPSSPSLSLLSSLFSSLPLSYFLPGFKDRVMSRHGVDPQLFTQLKHDLKVLTLYGIINKKTDCDVPGDVYEEPDNAVYTQESGTLQNGVIFASCDGDANESLRLQIV
jgi:hypothetical protein